MADNEVKIKVSLNSDEAIAKFKELQEYAERLCGGKTSVGGGGTSGNGTSVSEAANSAATTNDKEKKDGKNFGEAAANEMAKVSDRMGRLIGAQIFSVMRRMFSDSSELNYLSKLHAGINTFPIEKQYAQTNAMYGGLFGGAAAGFMLGGPLGAVAGGLGGALYNHYIAGRKADERQRLKEEQLEFSTKQADKFSELDYSRSIGRLALERKLKLTGDREGQSKLLQETLLQLQDGEGPNSIKSLKAKRFEMLHGNEVYRHAQEVIKDFENYQYDIGDVIKNKLGFDDELEKKRKRVEDAKKGRGEFAGQVAPIRDLNSEKAQEITHELDAQISSKWALQQQLFQIENLKQFVKPWEGSDFADSFTAKGLYSGANIDMEKANEPIINQLKELNSRMDKFLSNLQDKQVQESEYQRGEFYIRASYSAPQ